jgi:hypothetical protein
MLRADSWRSRSYGSGQTRRGGQIPSCGPGPRSHAPREAATASSPWRVSIASACGRACGRDLKRKRRTALRVFERMLSWDATRHFMDDAPQRTESHQPGMLSQRGPSARKGEIAALRLRDALRAPLHAPPVAILSKHPVGLIGAFEENRPCRNSFPSLPSRCIPARN